MDVRAQSHTDTPFSEGSAKADPVLAAAASTVHDALEQAESAVGDTTRKVTQANSRLPRSGRDALYDAVHSATAAAATLADDADLKQKQQHLLKTTTAYVSAHPLASLGIAFAAGLLFARITR
jgi:ElaB/YqjD/DUF883 family membrane-anchored ribosome-binding protein